MFSIRIDQMIAEYDSVERQTAELSRQLPELEQAIRELRNLSGMEGVISGLRKQHSEMEAESVVMNQMVQALGRISLDYMNCENRICDNGEQNVIYYTRQRIGVNEFTGIANILKEM